MLKELIESFLTKTTREARTLGYLYETIALKQRYSRRKKDWQEHIANCQAATLQATKNLGKAKTILILGSGPLLEIPMTELLRQFEKIILADFVHPRDVLAKWSGDSRVQFVEEDLLGLAKPLLDWKGGPLPEPSPPDLGKFHADYILSANCLSQLALKPRQFLESKRQMGNIDDYSEKLSAAHLRSIKKTGLPHLVIADFESRVVSESGEVLERTAPFFDRDSLNLLNSWNWKLAPAGEIHKRRSVEMSVGAFTIL